MSCRRRFRQLIGAWLASLAGASPVCAAVAIWDGGSSVNSNWSTGANWLDLLGGPGVAPANDGSADIIMAGTNRLDPLVDIAYDINSIQFNSTAGPFVFQAGGQPLSIRGGGITNNDADLQTLSQVHLGANHTWNAASGPLQVNLVTLGPLVPRMLTVSGAFNTSIQGTINGSATTNSGSIMLNSSANVTLGGTSANSFTGPITVNSGTLLLNKPAGVTAVPGDLIIGNGTGSGVVKLLASNQIANTSNVVINSSGHLDLNGFDEIVENLTMTGTTISSPGAVLGVTGAITTNASPHTASIVAGTVAAANFVVADGAALDDLVVTTSLISGFDYIKNGAGQMRLSGTTFVNIAPVSATVNGGTLLLGVDSDRLEAATVGDGVGGAGADVLRLLIGVQPHSDITVNESGVLAFDGSTGAVQHLSVRGGQVTFGTAIVGSERFDTLASASTAHASGGTLLLNDSQQSVPAALTVADGPALLDLQFDSVLASQGGLRIDGAGAMVFNGGHNHSGSLLINGGTVTFNTDVGGGAAPDPPMTIQSFVNFASTQHLQSLNVTGGRTNLATGGSRVLVTPVLTLDTTDAFIDIWEHAVIVDYTGNSPLNSIKAAITSAYNGGAWSGFGITSSLADATHGIGYGENAVLGNAFFQGETVDSSVVLIKYTLFGDANLDGQVDISDLAGLATSWQQSGVWIDGDFNYNGFVDISDLALLATNWQAGVGAPLSMSFEHALASVGLGGVSVPEPAFLVVLSASVLLGTRNRGLKRDL